MSLVEKVPTKEVEGVVEGPIRRSPNTLLDKSWRLITWPIHGREEAEAAVPGLAKYWPVRSVTTLTANHDDELAALRKRQRMQEIQDQLEAQAAQQFEAEERAEQRATAAANVDAILRR